VGVDRVFLSRTEAQARWAGATLGCEPGVRGRHSVGAQDRGAVARPAGRISQRADLLAAVAAVGGARGMAASLACLAGRVESPPVAGLG